MNQIQDWKKQLLSHAEEVFGNGATAGGENGERETEKLARQDRSADNGEGFFIQGARWRPLSERRQMVMREHSLPVTRRCELLEVARSTAYYRPRDPARNSWSRSEVIKR